MKKDQIKIGIILSYLSQLIQILTGLIYTPIMLHLLGQSEYGLYQLVYSTVSYLNLLSLGFGASYMRFYSRYKIKDEHEEIARFNGMFMTIFCILSIICIICGSIMIKNTHTIFGSGLTNDELYTAKILMRLMIINLAITFPNSVFNCIISANERFIFQKLLILIQNLLNPLLTFPLLLLGYGSIGIVVITTFLTFSIFLSNIYYCFKNLKVQFIFNHLNLSLLKEMWSFTFFIFLDQIIDQLNWSIDQFLLGRLIGTKAVAIYSLGGQINMMYIQLLSVIVNVFVPRINHIVAKSNDNKELTNLFTKIGRVQFMIMALILTGFIFFGKSFIYFWAGKGYEETYYVTLFLIGSITIPLMQNIGIEILRAQNKHQTRSIVYFCIAVANVFISIILIKLFGVIGAAIGTALALTIGNVFFMNWYYHKVIGLNIIYFWKETLKLIPALILPCIIGIIIKQKVIFNNLIYLGFWIMIYAIIYCIAIYLFSMNNEEKQVVKAPINKIIKVLRRQYNN